jgi:hypothetical protein
MTPLSAINKAKQNLDWMLSQVPRKINRRPSGFGSVRLAGLVRFYCAIFSKKGNQALRRV